VNSQGQIAAQNGDLTITSAGQVVLGGKTTATGNLTISAAQALNNQGTLAAGGVVTLAGSDLFNSGTLYSGGAMTLSASGQISNSGQIQAQGGALNMQAGGAVNNAAAGSIYSGAAINLTASSFGNAGVVEAAQGASLQISGNASNSGTLQADAGNLGFSAATLANTGTLSATGNATLSGSSSLSSTGTLVANGNVSLTSPQLTTGGTVQAGGTLALNGGTLSNSGKLYALGGAWTATLTAAFANQSGGDVYGSQSLAISAASLINAGGIESKQTDTVALSGAFTNSGKLQSDQADITLNAGMLSNTGTLSASGNLQAQLSGTAHNAGVLVSGQTINLAAASFDNQASGQVQSGADLSLSAATLANEGSINAKGSATLSGTDLSNASGAQWIASGLLTLDQTGSVTNAGVLQAGSDLDMTHATSLNNAAGATMYAGQDFNLGVAQALTNAGMLYAARTATFIAGSVNNSGTLRSGNTLTLDSSSTVLSSGAIQAQQSLSLQSGGAFTNSGELYAIDGQLSAQVGGAFSSASGGDIYSGQSVTFNASSFANAGALEAKQAVNLATQGGVSNSGTLQADGGNLGITGSSLTNQGKISATGAMQLSSTGAVSNSNSIVTGQTLALTGSSLTNSKQIQSGGNATVQAASVTNSGNLQAGGTLAFQHDATLTNQAGGSILAAGDLSTDTSSLLANAGVIQGGGNLSVTGAGAINNETSGTLYGTQLTTLQLGGGLTNAGTVYGAQGFNFTAASLASSGSLRSGASLSITTQGDASNTGSAYALGNAIWNIGGALTNNGANAVLAAAGNTTVTASSLAGNGTLAASLQSDGSLGSSGDLTVTTSGNLADNGRALAAGNLSLSGAAIDLSNSQARASNVTLTATQGNITNANGDLAANGAVAIKTPGSLINTGTSSAQLAKISASTLVLQAAALNNQYGSLVQTGNSVLNLSFTGAFQNAYGTLATNAQSLSIGAASIDNTGGTVQGAGNGTLSLVASGDLNNTAGKIAGNGALSLQSNGTLTNNSGTLSAAGDVTTKAGTFSNVSGTLIGNNVGLTVAQALTNTAGGTIQASGALNVSANTLDNTGGLIKLTDAQVLGLTTTGALTNGVGGFIGGNGAVTVNTGSLSNLGQIYAGTNLGVTAQSNLTNDNGAMQAQASASITSGGALSNRAGRIEAGSGNSNATLTLNAASLDNTSGRIANTGQGASSLAVAQNLINEGGTLGGQGALTLSAGSLDNNNAGKVVAGQTLTLGLGGMNNVGGTVYAASDINWNNGGATLENARGSLQTGGNLSFALASLDNAGGTLASNGSGNFNLGSYTGTGKIAAGQNLSLTLGGSYTNAAGNQLIANNNLTLSIAGNFSNVTGATLQAPNNLTLSAANIDNAAGATFNSNNTSLSTSGTLSNEGNIEGSTITLNAGALTNTANIIGGTVVVNAGSLTNGADLQQAIDNNAYQSALIAGSNSVALYVSGTLLNRDATIFTTGDLTLAGNANGGLSAVITNLSGDIEANGGVTLNALQFTNQRRVVTTSTYTLNSSEQASNKTTSSSTFDWTTDPNAVTWCNAYGQTSSNGHQLRCGPMGYYGDSGHETLTEQVTAVNRLASASAQSKLLAGGNITINGSVLNNASTIAAGNNLTINGQSGSNGGGATSNYTVKNIAWTPTATVQTTDVRAVDGDYLGSRWYSNREDNQPPLVYWTGTSSTTIALDPSGNNGWITIAPGQGLSATMSAGNTVSITAQTINNTTVGSNGQPVQSAIGLGSNNAGQAVGGGAATTVGAVSGTGSTVGKIGVGGAPGQANGTALSVADPHNVNMGSTAAANGGNASLVSPQVVSTLVGPNAKINLPQTGLYTINVQPGSQFLVETNPQFTQYSKFISSDYMLQKLGLNPQQTEQRLGDGFYEQQLVLDQITQLTGRRFLADSSDALDQYRNLMNNAVQVAQQFNLSVGVALTPEQMANLTQDMVWLVNVNVDGHQVLEPVLYLSASDAKNLAASGATIAGKNVVLTASGDITNNGTIAASQNAQLTASNLLNSGTISAGNDLSLTAAQNILNGGTLKAGGNVSLVAGNNVLSGVSVAQSLGTVNLSGLNTSISPVALSSLALPGSITAGGNLAISAGRDLSLDTAPIAAGANLSLAAGRDLTATATAIRGGQNVQVLAGRDLNLNAVTHVGGTSNAAQSTVDTVHTVSSLSAGGSMVVAAGQNLTSQGAQFTAGNQLALSAGQNVTLNAVTDNSFTGSGHESGHTFVTQTRSDDTVRGSNLSGANGVSVSAGHDLTTTAGNIQSANGNVVVAAGNDITLNAGKETHSTTQDTYSKTSGLLSSTTTKTHDATSDSYAVGASISGSNVTLAAGHDLTAQATQVHADQALSLGAGHDVALTAAYDEHQETHNKDVTKSGFTFNNGGGLAPQRKRTQTESSLDQQTAVGTLLSGDTVTVAANHDITTQAAQVAGTHDVTFAAGHDLLIGAAKDTLTQSDSQTKTTTGYIRDSAFSETTGKKKDQQTAAQTVTSYTGSLIGSTDGAVTLTAGNNAHITASEVLSQTATTIVGKNVTIDAAVGSQDTKQSYSQSESGITGGLGGGIVDSLQSAYYSAQRGSQVTDPRLKALYAAQAAYQAYDAYQGASSLAHGGGQGGGDSINVHVGIGASSSHGTTTTHDEQTYGSAIRSAGDVTIAATGGDLNVIGSQIKGTNVDLSAAHDLNLLSQGEAHTLQSSSKNASGGVGVQFGTDGFGIYAQAAVGQSKAHGNGETHTQTVVDATDTLSLTAGHDATLQGAQAKGNTVLADIGHNLTLISEQDTNDYASQQWQASGKVVIGFGGGSANGSYSQSKINNNYASVTQITGIGAGSGGFDIHVGGNTDLKGAVIASTASADKNLLDTGTLSYSNIANHSQMSASTIGVSGGYGSGGGSGAPILSMPQSGSQSSTTQAGIAQGTITIRNNPDQNTAGLNRNPSLDNANGLKNTFNAQKVQEQQEMGQVAGYVGMRAAGDVAYLMQKKAAEDLATANKNGDQAAEDEAKARLAAWSDGGADKILLHGLVGAVTTALGNGNAAQGAAGALAGEGISSLMQDWLIKQGINPSSAEGKSLMQLASAAVGGAVGGGAGATTALQGEQFNRQLHPTELSLIVGPMSEEYAKDYNAAHPDQPITQAQAESTLLNVALAKVDNQWAAKLGYGDPSAQAWLETHYSGLAFQRADGSLEQVFTATDAEKNDFGMYSNTYLSTFKNAVLEGARCRFGCTPTKFTTDNGLGFYNDYVDSNHGDLTLDGLYQKRQVSTLTPDQADTVAWLGGLKPILNWSTPPAGIVISLADKQYGQAAMQTVGLLAPVGLEAGAFNMAGKGSSVYDTALWQSLDNNEPLTLQNLQALYGDGNVIQGGGSWLKNAEKTFKYSETFTSQQTSTIENGTISVEPGATPDANEIRAGQGLANLGYDISHQATASSMGIQNVRTADLAVSDIGQIDVYTPDSNTPLNGIVRGIEAKASQANGVLIQADLSLSDMTTIASRTWGKSSTQSIDTLLFQKQDGTIVKFSRPPRE
jgi:filamentous hemagglutinin